jgi:hypothetical protein
LYPVVSQPLRDPRCTERREVWREPVNQVRPILAGRERRPPYPVEEPPDPQVRRIPSREHFPARRAEKASDVRLLAGCTGVDGAVAGLHEVAPRDWWTAPGVTRSNARPPGPQTREGVSDSEHLRSWPCRERHITAPSSVADGPNDPMRPLHTDPRVWPSRLEDQLSEKPVAPCARPLGVARPC